MTKCYLCARFNPHKLNDLAAAQRTAFGLDLNVGYLLKNCSQSKSRSLKGGLGVAVSESTHGRVLHSVEPSIAGIAPGASSVSAVSSSSSATAPTELPLSLNKDTPPVPLRAQAPTQIKAHLWVTSGPFFETVLFFFCSDRSLADATDSVAATVPLTLTLFDPDGAQFNSVQLFVNPHRPSVVELESLMGGCKIESGLKHAHAAIDLPLGWQACSRIVTREASCVLGSPSRLTSSARAFFPVVLSRERFPLIILLNRADSEVTVRARLFCGKRSPEAVWGIPPRGVRVMSVAHEFGEALAAELEDQVQAYLRLGVRGDYEVDAQMIERLQGPKEGSLYVAVT